MLLGNDFFCVYCDCICCSIQLSCTTFKTNLLSLSSSPDIWLWNMVYHKVPMCYDRCIRHVSSLWDPEDWLFLSCIERCQDVSLSLQHGNGVPLKDFSVTFCAVLVMKLITVQLLLWSRSPCLTGNNLQEDPTTYGLEQLSETLNIDPSYAWKKTSSQEN